MKTLALLSLSLAVALGMPPFVQDEAQNHPDLTKEDQSPLLGDLLPAQGHVVVDHPAPQVRLGSKDQQEKVAQVKEEPEVKPKLEVKEEPEVEPKLEVKEEPEVKPEAEVKEEPEVEPKLEVKEEPKVEPKLEVKEEPEVEPELEVKEEPEVEPELEVKEEPEVEPELEVKEEPEVEPELEVKEEPEAEQEAEVKEEPEVEPELEVKEEPEAEQELEVKEEPEVEQEPQLEDVPNFMAVSEEMEPEMNPMFTENEAVREVEEKFKVQMNLEPETETGQQFVERHADMERTHEVMVEPIMELEPLDDGDNMFGNDVEMPESQRNFEEPIMELEPETRQEEVVPEAAAMEEGPALDINGEPMPGLEEYFPNEEARMEMNSIMEEPESEYVREEEEPLPYEEPALMRQEQDNQATGLSSCPGVSYEGKCYAFFRGPKKAVDAELFCQQHFHGGHLASITTRSIHAKIMNMMRQQYGRYTRTWVGGLRYLDSGRFVWLDGSRWTYADWLSGEPNNTSNLEDCIEVLPNGKFNDFTCWEPQAFVCSYPQ